MSVEIPSLTTPAARPASRRLRRFGTVAVVATLLICALWLARAPLLRGAAEAWTVSDEIAPADVAVVLGGGTATRPFAAASYFRQGLVNKILVSNVRPDRSQLHDDLSLNVDLDRAVLLKLGIPESAIENFGSRLSNTYEESIALRAWAARNKPRSLLVPTEIFSSRRVRWLMKRQLAAVGARVNVTAVEDPNYTAANWWQDEKGVVAFQNEVIKYVYYRIKY